MIKRIPLPVVLVAAIVMLDGLTVQNATAQNETPSKQVSTPSDNPLTPAIRLAEQTRDALGKIEDYQAVFRKKERVGRQVFAHTMLLKHRAEPFSVYLRFYGANEGREVIYVKGQNEGNLVVHETGLAGLIGPISLAPTSSQAMSESLHPITSIGLWGLIDGIILQWKEEAKHGLTKVKYYPKAKLGKREFKVIETTLRQPRGKLTYHMTRLYLDKETDLPFKVEHFGFPATPGADPPLVAEYQYDSIKSGVALRDVDFDPRNPKYKYY